MPPVLWNATLFEVAAAGGTDQAEGTAAGDALWQGEAKAYYRANARTVRTAGGQGVLSNRVLYVERGLPVVWAIGHLVAFVGVRSQTQYLARVVEVVGTEAPPGFPASIDTVKLILEAYE